MDKCRNKKLRRLIRERMQKTGESYTAARKNLQKVQQAADASRTAANTDKPPAGSTGAQRVSVAKVSKVSVAKVSRESTAKVPRRSAAKTTPSAARVVPSAAKEPAGLRATRTSGPSDIVRLSTRSSRLYSSPGADLIRRATRSSRLHPSPGADLIRWATRSSRPIRTMGQEIERLTRSAQPIVNPAADAFRDVARLADPNLFRHPLESAFEEIDRLSDPNLLRHPAEDLPSSDLADPALLKR